MWEVAIHFHSLLDFLVCSHVVTPFSQWWIVRTLCRNIAVSKLLFESNELIAPFVKICVWMGLGCFYFLSYFRCCGYIPVTAVRATLSLSFRKSVGMDGRFAIFLLITFWAIILNRLISTRMRNFCVPFYVQLWKSTHFSDLNALLSLFTWLKQEEIQCRQYNSKELFTSTVPLPQNSSHTNR